MAQLHCTAEMGLLTGTRTHTFYKTQMYVNSRFSTQACHNTEDVPVTCFYVLLHLDVHIWLDKLILQYSCMGVLCYGIYNSVNTASCCPSGAVRQLFVSALVYSLCMFICALDVCDRRMACVLAFSAETHVVVIYSV